MKNVNKRTILLCLLLVSCMMLNGFSQEYRTETDLLGDVKVPKEAYYGAQAARGMENFQISGQYVNDYPDFIKAWGMVKLACAQANTEAGKMKPDDLKGPGKSAVQVGCCQ